MSSCSMDVGNNVGSAEQLCYIPCNFCNIVLAVSVPCSSLYDMVTVRCGHCTNLWSVNMAMAAAAFHSHSQPPPPPSQQHFFPLHPAPSQGPNHNTPEFRVDLGGSSSRCNNRMAMRPPPTTQERIVNRPPEKRQRVPSAYNQFIKEEIQRIKANNPDISHREAFSTAAKNWAHFPHIHFGLMLETNNQTKLDHEGSRKRISTRTALFNK